MTGEALAELGRILKTRKLFGRVDVKDVGVDSLAVVHGGAAEWKVLRECLPDYIACGRPRSLDHLIQA